MLKLLLTLLFVMVVGVFGATPASAQPCYSGWEAQFRCRLGSNLADRVLPPHYGYPNRAPPPRYYAPPPRFYQPPQQYYYDPRRPLYDPYQYAPPPGRRIYGTQLVCERDYYGQPIRCWRQ